MQSSTSTGPPRPSLPCLCPLHLPGRKLPAPGALRPHRVGDPCRVGRGALARKGCGSGPGLPSAASWPREWELSPTAQPPAALTTAPPFLPRGEREPRSPEPRPGCTPHSPLLGPGAAPSMAAPVRGPGKGGPGRGREPGSPAALPACLGVGRWYALSDVGAGLNSPAQPRGWRGGSRAPGHCAQLWGGAWRRGAVSGVGGGRCLLHTGAGGMLRGVQGHDGAGGKSQFLAAFLLSLPPAYEAGGSVLAPRGWGGGGTDRGCKEQVLGAVGAAGSELGGARSPLPQACFSNPSSPACPVLA